MKRPICNVLDLDSMSKKSILFFLYVPRYLQDTMIYLTKTFSIFVEQISIFEIKGDAMNLTVGSIS